MNADKIRRELNAIYNSGSDETNHKKLFELPENGEPTEIIIELSRTPENSRAVAVIEKSEPHYHNVITETYLVMRGGDLRLHVDDELIELAPGDEYVITPGQRHWAESNPHNPTFVQVDCSPPWSPEDHHLVK